MSQQHHSLLSRQCLRLCVRCGTCWYCATLTSQNDANPTASLPFVFIVLPCLRARSRAVWSVRGGDISVNGSCICRRTLRLFSKNGLCQGNMSKTDLIVRNHVRLRCLGRHDGGLVGLMRGSGRDGDAILPNMSAPMWCNHNCGGTYKCFEVHGRMDDGLGRVV